MVGAFAFAGRLTIGHAGRIPPNDRGSQWRVLAPERRGLMSLSAEKQMEHLGETCGCADHDHDLVHELSKRLDALWRYDRRIANADGHADLQAFWRDLKRQEMDNVKRLKQMLGDEIRKGCF